VTLTVTSAASYSLFTELATVKREMDVSPDDPAEDKQLFDLIQQATDFIVRYTGRRFVKQSYTETVGSRGTPNIVLQNVPVVSITGVEYRGSTVSSTSYEIEDADAGIVFNKVGWTDTQVKRLGIGLTPTRFRHKDWSISYQAGYVAPGSTDGARTLPHDVERACIDLVKMWYYQRSDDPSVRYEKTGDAAQMKFDKGDITTLGIPPSVVRILEKYRQLT